MVKIEYNKDVINVPENWNEITLGQYERFYTRKPETNREHVEFVAEICAISPEALLAMDVSVFDNLVHILGFMFQDSGYEAAPSMVIDGVTYVVSVEDRLTVAEWVDADTAQKEGLDVISNVLAIVCRPSGETYDSDRSDARRDLFKAQPFSTVAPVMSFFLQCNQQLSALTQAFISLKTAADLLPRNIRLFQRHGAGIRISPIWPTIKYYFLMLLLRYQLRNFSRKYFTDRTKNAQTPRRGNSTRNSHA